LFPDIIEWLTDIHMCLLHEDCVSLSNHIYHLWNVSAEVL